MTEASPRASDVFKSILVLMFYSDQDKEGFGVCWNIKIGFH